MRLKFLNGSRIAAPPEWLLRPLAFPIERLLSASVRRLARTRPEIFRRLGLYQTSTYLIIPHDLPVAFRLLPRAEKARVEVVDRSNPGPSTVQIGGALQTLIGLFDGSVDADSTFFSRALRVEGATDAALALHNALEAADLDAGDILGLPGLLKGPFDRLYRTLNARIVT
jgi:predicted lipid carrier protein YhbT